jgi:hypothetical protein
LFVIAPERIVPASWQKIKGKVWTADRIDAFYNLEPDRQIVDNDKSGGTDAEGKERT